MDEVTDADIVAWIEENHYAGQFHADYYQWTIYTPSDPRPMSFRDRVAALIISGRL